MSGLTSPYTGLYFTTVETDGPLTAMMVRTAFLVGTVSNRTNATIIKTSEIISLTDDHYPLILLLVWVSICSHDRNDPDIQNTFYERYETPGTATWKI